MEFSSFSFTGFSFTLSSKVCSIVRQSLEMGVKRRMIFLMTQFRQCSSLSVSRYSVFLQRQSLLCRMFWVRSFFRSFFSTVGCFSSCMMSEVLALVVVVQVAKISFRVSFCSGRKERYRWRFGFRKVSLGVVFFCQYFSCFKVIQLGFVSFF